MKLMTLEETDDRLRIELRLLINESEAIKQDNKLLFQKLSISEEQLQDREQ